MTSRVREGRRVGDDQVEIDRLGEAILDRLRRAEVEQPADADFVRYRFCNQLRNYWSWNGLYALAFIAVTIGALVTSLASSSIAAGWSGREWAKWTILALGIIGAIAGLVNWSWKPGQKAVSRTRGRNALRAEGWAFVQARGRYKGVDDVREAWGLFVDEVGSIAQAAAEVDESLPEGQPPGTAEA